MFLLYIKTGLCFPIFFFLHKHIACEKNIYHELCAKNFVTLAARSVKILGARSVKNFGKTKVFSQKCENM